MMVKGPRFDLGPMGSLTAPRPLVLVTGAQLRTVGPVCFRRLTFLLVSHF